MQLSDLNLRAQDSFAYDAALSGLLASNRLDDILAAGLDCIFCTGDVAQSGKAEEYKLATEFFHRLSEMTRVPIERIFTVPGNHDVERARLSQAFRLSLPNAPAVDRFFSSEEDLSIGLRPLHNYIEFERQVFGRSWTPSIPYISSQFSVRGLTLAVVGFNTTWLARDDSQKGMLVLGHALIQKTLEKVSQSKPDIVIAVMHHPTSWLAKHERDLIQGVLSERASFVLHGHVRASGGYEITASPDECVTLGTGLGAHGDNHGRSLLTVNVTSDTFSIEPWVYEARGAGRWVAPGNLVQTLKRRRLPSPSSQSPQRLDALFPFDVLRYLSELTAQKSYLDVASLVRDRTAPAISIDEMFVTPDLHAEEPSLQGYEHIASSESLDVERLVDRSNRILLLGNPGTGKTVLLKRFALSRARALMANEPNAPGNSDRLPIYLQIQLIAKSDHENAVTDNVIQCSAFRAIAPYGGTRNWLTGALRDGRIVILLDGLDEVASQPGRNKILGQIADFTARWPNTQVIATSRPLAYLPKSESTPWSLSGFVVCHVRPFSEEQVEAFVRRAMSSLYPDPRGAEDMSSKLLRTLRRSMHLSSLSATPLLLWSIILVFRGSGKIPTRRAGLYKSALATLVGRWDSTRGIVRSTLFGELSIDRRLDLLSKIALIVHRRGAAHLTFETSLVAQTVYDAGLSTSNSEVEVEAFLREMAERTGLLVEELPNSWRFAHLSFQEYLAALGVLEFNQQPADELVQRISDPWWREVELLALEASEDRGATYAKQLLHRVTTYVIEELAPMERPAACGLLASAIVDGEHPNDEVSREQLKPLIDAALQIVSDSQQLGTLSTRVQLARLLGMSGDPRIGWEDERHFSLVPAGYVMMGGLDASTTEDELPPQSVYVSTFLVGRFLVTNSQFLEFVTSGAYSIEKYWAAQFGRRTDLQSLMDRLRNEQNAPVTDVSWFEADAFCRWLNDSRPRGDGMRWRLPTEAEWEKAARGGSDSRGSASTRIYPWGDTWSRQNANADGALDRPTAVGLFPLGVGPYGTFDQAGNVSEWCQDGFWTYGGPQNLDPLGMTSSVLRAVRGGCWSSSPREVRASSRAWSAPSDGKSSIGFRVVASTVTPIPARPPNPFQPGTALPPDAPPPGRIEVVSELTSRIAAHGSCALLGPRRSGKTSILSFLRTALGSRQSVQSVWFLDLQGHPCSTPDMLAAGLEPSLFDHPRPAVELRRLLSAQHHPVILLDELGRLQNVDTDEDPNVFEWLRSLGQEGVALVLAGTSGDWDNIQLKDAEKPGSSFTNIMKPVHLGPLSKSEALSFLVEAAPDDIPIDPEREGCLIVELTGGWPFYLQVVAHAFVEEVRGRRMTTRPTEMDIKRLYQQALLYDYDFVFRQRWRELGAHAQGILIRGQQGQLPDPSRLSPFDIEHLERQGLYDQRRGWLLALDIPFLDWIRDHHDGLFNGSETER